MTRIMKFIVLCAGLVAAVSVFGQTPMEKTDGEPQMQEASSEPQTEEASSEPQMDGASSEAPIEEASAEPQMEETDGEPQMQEASSEPQMEEASSEAPMEEASSEPSMEEASGEQPMQQADDSGERGPEAPEDIDADTASLIAEAQTPEFQILLKMYRKAIELEEATGADPEGVMAMKVLEGLLISLSEAANEKDDDEQAPVFKIPYTFGGPECKSLYARGRSHENYANLKKKCDDAWMQCNTAFKKAKQIKGEGDESINAYLRDGVEVDIIEGMLEGDTNRPADMHVPGPDACLSCLVNVKEGNTPHPWGVLACHPAPYCSTRRLGMYMTHQGFCVQASDGTDIEEIPDRAR